jgi:uncharacterized membrane protein YphA (DoxX/SURF4 family)
MPFQTKAASVLLWIAQLFLAVLFLFAGIAKLTMPLASVARMTGLPVVLLQCISVLEILGAVGLVLPGLLRIRRALTPLAAIGLTGVMTGATILTATSLGVEQALFPAFVGALLVIVILGRRRWAERSIANRPAIPYPAVIAQVAQRAA